MYWPVREFNSTALDLTAKCLVDCITHPPWFVLKGSTQFLKVVNLCIFEAFLLILFLRLQKHFQALGFFVLVNLVFLFLGLLRSVLVLTCFFFFFRYMRVSFRGFVSDHRLVFWQFRLLLYIFLPMWFSLTVIALFLGPHCLLGISFQ